MIGDMWDEDPLPVPTVPVERAKRIRRIPERRTVTSEDGRGDARPMTGYRLTETMRALRNKRVRE